MHAFAAVFVIPLTFKLQLYFWHLLSGYSIQFLLTSFFPPFYFVPFIPEDGGSI